MGILGGVAGGFGVCYEVWGGFHVCRSDKWLIFVKEFGLLKLERLEVCCFSSLFTSMNYVSGYE
jgi:hypothetical protein